MMPPSAVTRIPTLATVLIGAALTLSACTSTCRPGPTSRATTVQPTAGPPTAWSLVLEVQPSGVRLVDAKPARGKIIAPTLEERAAAVRARNSLWVEYAIRADSGSRVLHTGGFPVSLAAIVEPGGPAEPGGTTRVGRRFVAVAVPYVSEPASITFARVNPAAGIPVDKWERVSLGTAALKGVTR